MLVCEEELKRHSGFVAQAFLEARKAAAQGEVPVGAVLVSQQGLCVGRGHNVKEQQRVATRHAEIEALEQGSRHLGRWRLSGCTLYTSLEPCVMCLGAIMEARVDHVVYALRDYKSGAFAPVLGMEPSESCESLVVPRVAPFNHRLRCTGPVASEEAQGILREFFSKLRRKA